MKETLPESFLQEVKELFGEEYEAYLASFERPARPSLRVNTLKISAEEFQKIAPFPLARIPWTADGFYYDEKDRPSLHPYYYAGLYYLQEASAMVPAETLEIEEGDL
ncbi:MAG: SAM-dependent methyltransferase, partial [Erysipelotrichaceae bacterium]|nr:SAM-dependent methyltransferase [Erysipelotrichaceae bacterium]